MNILIVVALGAGFLIASLNAHLAARRARRYGRASRLAVEARDGCFVAALMCLGFAGFWLAGGAISG